MESRRHLFRSTVIAAFRKNAASELGRSSLLRSSFFVVLRRRQHVLWPIYPSPRPREGFDGVRRASAVAYLFTEKGAECSGAVQGPLSAARYDYSDRSTSGRGACDQPTCRQACPIM